jgi:hypothetical protein
VAKALYHDPLPGDVLTMRDGRTRTLTAIHKYGEWTEMIVVGRSGRSARSYGTLHGWCETARVEVAKGGTYERPASPDAPASSTTRQPRVPSRPLMTEAEYRALIQKHVDRALRQQSIAERLAEEARQRFGVDIDLSGEDE